MAEIPLIIPTPDHVNGQPEPPTPPEPERISEGELAFHQFVVAQQQRLAGLERELLAIQAGRDFWLAHLRAAYGLVDGDQITNDGTILRAVAEG